MSASEPIQRVPTACTPGGAAATGTRLRARYAKTGKLRFVSAIDLGRLWERALRKARLPIAYSEGFSPHPKVSFPDALPLGNASEAEYVELTFAVPVEPAAVLRSLNASFPPGIEVKDAVVADGAPRLAKGLRASVWELEYPPGVDAGALAAAVGAVLRADEVIVARQRKDEVTDVDARPALAALHAAGRRVRALVHHVEPPIRPTELQQAFAPRYEATTQRPLPAPALVTRVAQGTPNGDGLDEALSGATVAVAPSNREDEPTP